VTTTKKPAKKTSKTEKMVAMDRRRSERRKADEPVATERRKKANRRRQIDPTTCERDYTPDEIEFMNALDEYKRANGRMFPTCSEVLEVVRNLGYVKQPVPTAVLPTPQNPQAALGSPAPVPGQMAADFFEPAIL